MKVVYYSYYGTYAAYLAASLHTGICRSDKQLVDADITRQYEFCRRYAGQFGNLIYVGMDEECREIYCLGCKKQSAMIQRAHQHMAKIFGIDEPSCYLNVHCLEGHFPVLFNLLHSRLGEERLWRKLYGYWYHSVYRKCLKAVEQHKTELKNGGGV